MQAFAQQLIAGIATGGIYASVALALVMIYQATHHVNFAQGEMATFSTYLAWAAMQGGAPWWAAFVGTVVASFAIAFAYSRRAGRSADEFFLSGRAMPWWLAGTSMVATTFAADTPLAVTGLTVKYGIAGNWLWWSFVMSGMLTVVFYARLWRRAGVTTDAEFAEIRYSGTPAAFLRGFRACYLGLAVNAIIIGWVTAAMTKILALTVGLARAEATLVLFGLTGLYAAVSGLWGVVVTDFFQFVLAMLGCVALAYFALGAVGGLGGLLEALQRRFPDDSPLALVPALDSAWMPALTFFAYLGFAVISFTAADIPNPERNVARATYIALGITTALYIAIALGVFGTLTVEEVIAYGGTALADAVAEKSREAGHRPTGIEGTEGSEWVLLDLQDTLVHVMLPRVRAFYNLEKLWSLEPAGDLAVRDR